ncbi:uncharacterized protein LOC143298716 [Babylonia areolata]|uniref:uncharacterized protein LOC143298716 n=1 Tax=Babylonia areolata TaxID=304850 RepID=UPI003FD2267F
MIIKLHSQNLLVYILFLLTPLQKMKLAPAVIGLCVMVVTVTAKPSKRFISIHDIEHGLHHLGHEIEHGLHHVGHEIEHGIHHLGHELGHITGIHSAKDLACKLYSTLKGAGEAGCDAKCIVLVSETVYGVALCPEICHMIFHEADKVAHC